MRFLFKPSSLAVCTFPAVCLNIQLKIRSTSESRLFPGSRRSGVKRKIKQSVVKWIEPNCAFKIINFHLPYPLYLFLFIIHFCILLSYYFFLPSTFNCTHVRTVRTGSYAPDFLSLWSELEEPVCRSGKLWCSDELNWDRDAKLNMNLIRSVWIVSWNVRSRTRLSLSLLASK